MVADRPAQPPICPECSSSRVWKDGLRKTSTSPVQRWICRNCGYRFSEQTSSNDKKGSPHTLKYQVCADGAKNLVVLETRHQKQDAGATTDLKSLLINFLWFLKKQGKAEDTIRLYVEVLGVLAKRGADLNDPESVKKTIALQESWSMSRKDNAVKAYSAFLEMHGLTWLKPKYKVPEKLPFIPNEAEIDCLIASCSKQMGTFLQTLKETAARRGEIFSLKWTDIDFTTNTVRITPEKGSNPRVVRISMKLAAMLNSLPRTTESNKIWVYKNKYYLDKQFRRQRKRAARKQANPRVLQIRFHTLRHWKATMLCHETNGNVYYVMRFLGHKSIKSTMRYIHLWQALFPQREEYVCEVAGSIEEAKKLIEAGFEYVTEMEERKLFRKRMTSLIALEGSSTIQEGSSASLV